jgi:pimeloyl-ACP methyl ester carboxylesterase
MNTPEWLKPVALGVVIGAIAASTIGFSWGGWVTGGTAAKMANALSHDKVIAALVPVCVGMSRADTSVPASSRRFVKRLPISAGTSSWKQAGRRCLDPTRGPGSGRSLPGSA